MPKKTIFKDSDSEESDPEIEDVEEAESSDIDLAEESDSDAAPDNVTFSQSKADALKKVTDAMTSIGKEKERQKLKRRLKDDQYKKQKKKKLEELSKNRLPDDILQSITSVPPPLEPDTTEEEPKQKDLDESLNEFDEPTSDGEDVPTDFIPLGGSNVKAVYIKEQSKVSQSASDTVWSFREKQLYGRKIRRISDKKRQALSTKRQAMYR